MKSIVCFAIAVAMGIVCSLCSVNEASAGGLGHHAFRSQQVVVQKQVFRQPVVRRQVVRQQVVVQPVVQQQVYSQAVVAQQVYVPQQQVVVQRQVQQFVPQQQVILQQQSYGCQGNGGLQLNAGCQALFR